MASSADFPVRDIQASCLAFLTKSKGFSGALFMLSPSVACLYKAYNWSKVSLLGLSDRDSESFTAFSNNSLVSMGMLKYNN